MSDPRFLGGAWASIHGPAEPRALLTWTLDAGFSGLVPGPSPRSLDWRGLRPAMADLPVAVPAVRVESIQAAAADRRDGGIASTARGDREAAATHVADAVGLATALGCRRVVLEPGLVPLRGDADVTDFGEIGVRWTEDGASALLSRRNAQLPTALDAACRFLHAICKRFPETEFCLSPSRFANGLGDPVGLQAIFEDLGAYRLRYWHDAAIVARRAELLDEPEGRWLEAFASRMGGVTLADCANGALYLPPGAGSVDYPLLATYCLRGDASAPAVIELDPAVDAAELPGIHAFLDKFRL